MPFPRAVAACYDVCGNPFPKVQAARTPSGKNESRIFTVDKSQLDEYVGTLSAKRVREILNGIKLVLDPREPE